MTDQPNVTGSPAPEHPPEVLAAENEGLPLAQPPPALVVPPNHPLAAEAGFQPRPGFETPGLRPGGGVTWVEPGHTPPFVPLTPPPQVPSLGRIVILRAEHHDDAPAMITRVYSLNEVSMHVFHDDLFPHHASKVSQIDPAQSGVFGWFWPPRV